MFHSSASETLEAENLIQFLGKKINQLLSFQPSSLNYSIKSKEKALQFQKMRSAIVLSSWLDSLCLSCNTRALQALKKWNMSLIYSILQSITLMAIYSML